MTRIVEFDLTTPVGINFQTARAGLITAMEACRAAIPGVDFYYAGPIDLDAASSPCVFAQAHWDSAKALGLGPAAGQRVFGSFSITVFWVEGSGGASARNVLSYLNKAFDRKVLGVVQTHAPHPGHYESRHGWESQALLVPFWYDS